MGNLSPATPNITSFSPAASTVKNTVGEKRTFGITTDQTANFIWSLNNALVQTDNSVIQSNYVNASASQGTWIVTSIVNNAKGSAIQTWVWVVEPASRRFVKIAVITVCSSIMKQPEMEPR